MIKESEWNTINAILLELYTLNDVLSLSKKVLNVLKMLIQYSKGYFIYLDENKEIDIESSVFFGFTDEQIQSFKNEFYLKDYHHCLCDITKGTVVYHDTALLDSDVRLHSEFFQNFLKPAGVHYGCGMLIIKNGRVIGLYNLYREKEIGDFSKKDISILDILKDHLENILDHTANVKSEKSSQVEIFEECLRKAVKTFSLSEREKEILYLIADGKSNNEICEKLCVSLSTVKKHVYNIFNKSGVNSRTQLLNTIYSI